jgi:hypothetical protein
MVDVGKILTQLQARRAAINDCILVLERLAAIRGPWRGRPPKWMTTPTAVNAPKQRGHSPESGRKLTGGQSA